MAAIKLVIKNESLDPYDWVEVCKQVLETLVELTPIDTGFCRDSWDYDISPEECTFYNDCEYASYLDEGWSKQAPNGIIGPTLEKLPEIIRGYA